MTANLWSVVTLAGIWGMVGCTVGFILKSFPARGVFDRARALGWGAAVLVSFVVWTVGMANA